MDVYGDPTASRRGDWTQACKAITEHISEFDGSHSVSYLRGLTDGIRLQVTAAKLLEAEHLAEEQQTKEAQEAAKRQMQPSLPFDWGLLREAGWTSGGTLGDATGITDY